MALVTAIGTALGVSMTAGASIGLGAGVAAGITGTAALGAVGAGIGLMADANNQADKIAAQNKAVQQKYIADTSSVPAAVTDATGVNTGDLAPISDIGQSAATGGLLALKKGGHVPLKDGAYIIPADVVSALGNGSSKAGAEFLRRLLVEVRNESVKRQGLGAVSNKNAT